ncbi:hypothetical protein [Ekhidna sp. To15]|uniref:hypothetical protein n=1 Tax=Ekhidna sp. To15 TaxID=3395267 RepID=UPI003F522318
MIHRYLYLLSIAFLTSCSLDFDNEWKRDPYEGTHFNKLVVVGLSHDLESRKFYENEAVTELEKSGFHAVEGLKIFPQEVTELDHNQDSITSLIEENKVDAVLVIKILHENDESYMMPEDYSKFKKIYFRRRSFHTYNSNYYERPEKYYMIATLYDLKEKHQENEETVVWRASSLIINPAENKERKKSFIDDVVEHITEQHLIE